MPTHIKTYGIITLLLFSFPLFGVKLGIQKFFSKKNKVHPVTQIEPKEEILYQNSSKGIIIRGIITVKSPKKQKIFSLILSCWCDK